LPGALNAILDRLIGRAFVRINSESSLGLVPGAGWNLEFISQADLGDLENPVHVFNIPFHKRDEIVCGLDFPRFQRGGKGSGESPTNAGNHMIEGCRIFRSCDLTAVFLLVEVLDPAVHAEVNGLREVLNVGRAVRAFMFQDTDMTSVGYGHDSSSTRLIHFKDDMHFDLNGDLAYGDRCSGGCRGCFTHHNRGILSGIIGDLEDSLNGHP
jgi:hypothetical protein